MVQQLPAGKIFWVKYEAGKDVNQVNILCQVQVAGQYGFDIFWYLTSMCQQTELSVIS